MARTASLPAHLFAVLVPLFLSVTSSFSAQTTDKTPLLLHSKPLSARQVRLGGELATRYDAATCNLLTRTDRYTLDSFVANAAGREGALWWDWPGDQFGRWFSVLDVAEGYGWSQAAWHRRAVAGVILPLQSPDGNFGPNGVLESDDARIPSGNAFALRGLLDAYRDTRDERYLEAARRLARYFEKTAPRWEHKQKGGILHEFYGHCIDGLVALYELGGDRWALDLAKRLGASAGRAPHTHHALSLCRGLIDLARVTGERRFLDKAEDYLAWCRANQLVTGGLPESMPRSPQDEGCCLADWIVVNLMMFECTGQDRYLDDAEHMLVNHFFMNQFHTGGFGHCSFDQEIVGGKDWQGWNGQFGSENPGCCSLWGQWALGQTGRFLVTRRKDKLFVNLYADARIALAPSKSADPTSPNPSRDREEAMSVDGVHLEIAGDFPRMHRAAITVRCDQSRTFTLALRIPRWAELARVKCDGRTIKQSPDSGRLVLRREWKSGDTVSVEFISGLRLVAWPPTKPQGTAVFDGPLCLGLSSAQANLTRPWSVHTDASGQRPSLDHQGRPAVYDPTDGCSEPLAPIAADWLAPDAKDPRRRRVLFKRQ